MSSLPPYITRELVLNRLQLIFPEGLANRGYVTREMAASTVFTLLYIGAVVGNETYMGPVHVYRMTHEQAAKADDGSRITYGRDVLKRKFEVEGKRWYADNTREPLRDETLNDGLILYGVVISLNLPTTSSRPRYALTREFTNLFDPKLANEALLEAIEHWQEAKKKNVPEYGKLKEFPTFQNDK